MNKYKTIISLVPSITNILYEITNPNNIIGITPFCPETNNKNQTLPKVGGPWNIDIEKIISLKPDVVFASKEENLKDEIEKLIESGINVYLSDIKNLADLNFFIEHIVSLIEISKKGEIKVKKFNNEFDEITKGEKIINKVSVLTFVWWNPERVLGLNTFANDIIELAGGKNIISFKGYPEISIEKLSIQKPDIIILPDEPYNFSQKEMKVVKSKIKCKNIIFINGKLLFWYDLNSPENIKNVKLKIQSTSCS